MTVMAKVFPKLRTSKNVVKLRRFTVLFNNQHGQQAQKLFKSEGWHVYDIY